MVPHRGLSEPGEGGEGAAHLAATALAGGVPEEGGKLSAGDREAAGGAERRGSGEQQPGAEDQLPEGRAQHRPAGVPGQIGAAQK